MSDVDFGDAMRDVVRGCKVARRDWPKGTCLFVQASVVHIQIPEDDEARGLKQGIHKFILSEGDLSAEDWIVV